MPKVDVQGLKVAVFNALYDFTSFRFSMLQRKKIKIFVVENLDFRKTFRN